jgi:xanthine dehydrogenase accessory factor
MTLHAAEASELLLSTAEKGGTAVVVVVVGGGMDSAVGRRIALRRLGPRAEAEVTGSLGSHALDREAISVMEQSLTDPRVGDGLRHVEVGSVAVELYLEIRRPIQDLIVVGAGHIAQPLSRMGAALGFRVTVLDDRPDFATRERFPEAYRVTEADFSDPFADVPIHERSHILLVTRGHKYDYECLIRALRMDPLPGYIGMIGSRRRVRATYVQLLEDGIEPELLEYIHAPVGLDIGAETPEEIAIAVAAELVMVRRGGSGASLKGVERVAERFFGSKSVEGRE